MSKNKKFFVLDTNVLISNPAAITMFDQNVVIIPDIVLNELDNFKKESNERGAHSRQIARTLDDIRKTGSLIDGVKLDNGSILKIEQDDPNVVLPDGWIINNDARIIRTALKLQNEGKDVHFVSKDIFARIRAESAGLKMVEDYFADHIVEDSTDEYTGRCELYTESINLAKLNRESQLDISLVSKYSEKTGKKIKKFKLEVNEFVLLRGLDQPQSQTMLARFDGEKLIPTNYTKVRPFGVIPRSLGQTFMQEALLSPASELPLVIIKGPAGTAKTFYSVACGLSKFFTSHKEYRKMLICRPTVTMGEDIGFLPGTEEAKIAPFMRSILDNLEQLVDSDDDERYNDENELQDKIQELFDRKVINTEAIAYIRGRSIVKQWVIIDEAQNLTPKQAKSIITRAGEGTKIILIGDPAQIDHPFMDSKSNGLSYAADKMKGSKLCAQLTLTSDDCERSPLAADSSERM